MSGMLWEMRDKDKRNLMVQIDMIVQTLYGGKCLIRMWPDRLCLSENNTAFCVFVGESLWSLLSY